MSELDVERLAQAMCEASHEDWNRYEDQKANWRYAQKVVAVYARLAESRDGLAMRAEALRVSGLAEMVHARSGTLEYSEADRTLVWTDRIGPDEYGASAIVADHVLPWFGRLIAEAADPQNTLAEYHRLAESRPRDGLAEALREIVDCWNSIGWFDGATPNHTAMRLHDALRLDDLTEKASALLAKDPE
jgi:hypothetical protein